MRPSGDSGSPTRRALFLCPEPPYPLMGGGAMRSASVLAWLAHRYDAVDAIFFWQPGNDDPLAAIPKKLIERARVLELPFHGKDGIARTFRNLRRLATGVPPLVDRFAGFERQVREFAQERHYDLGVIEHFWCAPYLSAIRENCGRVLLDLHNIESMWHRRLAATENWLAAAALRRFGARCRSLEREWLPRFDAVLTPSQDDARLVRSLAPGARASLYPNALPEISRPLRVEEDVIAFSGNLEYRPNRDAVRFFAREIWPGLRAQWPDLRWRIIGKNPQGVSGEVRGDPRIELTGPVEDAVAELAKAKVAVAPVRAGSGTRIKILEAWAAGTAVVSTTMGAEGLDAVSGEQLLLADAPAEFCESVSALLASHQKRQRLGEAGRLRYQEQYSWTACEGLLDKVVSELSCGKSVN